LLHFILGMLSPHAYVDLYISLYLLYMIVSIRPPHVHSRKVPHALRSAPHVITFLPYLYWRLKNFVVHKSNNIQTSFFIGDRLREQPSMVEKCFIVIISLESLISDMFWRKRGNCRLRHKSQWNVYLIHGAKTNILKTPQ
jgi:hypothetical protein